ncbi:T9SS type A sorting domain-containing protein [Fulvivirga sp. RKSG066]|uniref:T9SS type A sorting domain-containing protein n=1 Tax=Fulvivirga aurantia TaxID=2529383 RepID=UPI0012BC6A7E|nr:T9SS type A sorting domain-containing protein [Fulvivirga aurantia]MTI20781.1 T9SS type A sorting domain-containing protein [Fulvivirga aurantia]
MRTVLTSLILLFTYFSAYSQCDFTISPTNPGSNCQYAIEEIVWTSSANVSITGNNITKNAGGNNNWNGGAVSTAAVYDNGYVEFTAGDQVDDKIFGLSNADGGINFGTVEFGFDLENDRDVKIYESGNQREGTYGSYSTGDVFRVAVQSGVIHYYWNGTLLYVSNTSPTLPLIADIALNDLGASFTNGVIANGVDGNFTATATNPGSGPSYAWFLNGAPTGVTGTSYTNNSLVAGDQITATLNPGTGGCALGVVNSNTITIAEPSPTTYATLFVEGTSATDACKRAVEPVTFTDIVNIEVSGNNLIKEQGNNNNWNAGVASVNTVADNGYMEFTIGDQNTDKIVGLSSTNTNEGFGTVEFGFDLENDRDVKIYESNTQREGTYGNYSNGDVFRIAVEDGIVHYYWNGTLLYISNVTPSLPLIVDASFNDEGATINNVIIANGNTGQFSANVTNAGANPLYQWTLNGIDEPGETGSTYTNTTLANGDEVAVIVQPDLDNCSNVTYTTQAVTIETISTPDFGTFYVENTASADACKEAIEQVVFTDIVNIEATGNDISKEQGGSNNWNAGVASLNSVKDNGYLEFVIGDQNTDKIVGLSTTNTDAGFNTVEFGFDLENDRDVKIYESGTQREGTFGNYNIGDTFRISVENGVVHYYWNSNLLYISNVTPTLPLIADVSFNDEGAVINDVIISNGNTGQFSAILTDAGASPSFQWTLNGIDQVGETNSTYTNTSLADGDVVSVIVQPDLGGCGDVSYTANTVTINEITTPEFGVFYVENTAATDACKEAIEQVVFTDIVNIEATGNDISKEQGGNNNWNAGVASLNSVKDNGYLEFTIGDQNTDKIVGLSNTNADADFGTVQFGFDLENDRDIKIYESGIQREGTYGNYSIGDIFKIAVEDGVVHYYWNGTLLYLSNVTPTLPLIADISFHDEGASINDVIISNGNTGQFSAIVTDAGANPLYQWTLNGVDEAGETNSTYTNTNLADGDVVTVLIQPDLGGCGDVTYTANTVTIREISTPEFGTFYIENTASDEACKEAIEQVVFTDIVNIETSGNDIIKEQGGNNNWNAGVASLNSVKNNGYMEFVVGDQSDDKIVGLSSTNADAGFNSIEYGFDLESNRNVKIYESGTQREGTFGSYSIGDVFRISVEEGVVNYYWNGNLLYVSTTVPILPLIFDTSFNDEGAAINDVIISNGNTGQFTAIVTDAGANPSYQWTLNGIDEAGETNSTYTNTSLSNGDVVSVGITPDLGGCSDVTYMANNVTINNLTSPTFGTFFISNTPSTDGLQPVAFEDITWTDEVNVFTTGNAITKGQAGNNNWNAGAASLNTVVNDSYAQAVITETGADKIFGLSNTNSDAAFNSVQFGFDLENDGDIKVYESGTQRGGTLGSYSVGDTLKVAVRNNNVEYYQNSTLLYTSTVTPTLPLIIDLSLHDEGAALSNVAIVSLTDGVFTATAPDAGANPTYQWKLDGVNVGANSPTYTNSSLNNDEVITLDIIPDIGGCSSNAYTSNQILIQTSNAVLPVSLIAFQASTNQDVIDLQWSTASETNNDYFIIEKSSDGVNYNRLSKVKGAGNASQVMKYTATDARPFQGTNYYRLSQVDFDGTTAILGVVSATYAIDIPLSFNLFPNPGNGVDLEVTGTLFGFDQLEVLDINGIVLETHKIDHLSRQKLKFEKTLSKGMYFIKLSGEEEVQVKRYLIK